MTGCNTGWTASHGQPHLETDPLYASHGLVTHLQMVAGTGTTTGYVSDGLYTSVTFPTGGVPYVVSFDLRDDYSDSPGYYYFDVSLATTGSLPVGTGYSGPEAEPSVSVLSTQHPVLNMNRNWATYTVTLTPPAAGTYLVWFRIHLMNNPPPNFTDYASMLLDNVTFNCGYADIKIQNTSALSGLTSTKGAISAGRTVDSSRPSGPVTVLSGQSVAFRAFGTIELAEGFSADAGSTFSAIIPLCPDQTICDCLIGRNGYLRGTSASSLPSASVEMPQSEAVTTLFPNPTAGRLEFQPGKRDLKTPGQFIVYNKDGQQVRTIDLRGLPHNEGRVVMDVSTLKSGLYHYRFVSDKYTESGHFSVEK